MLVVSGEEVDLGTIPAGVETVEFRIRNETASSVACLGWSTSCECAELDFDQTTPLERGEERACKLTVRVLSETALAAHAQLVFSGSHIVRLRVVVRGGDPPAVSRRPTVQLGPIYVGEIRTETLSLRVDPSLCDPAFPFSERARWTVEEGAPLSVVDEKVVANSADVEFLGAIKIQPTDRRRSSANVHCKFGDHLFSYRVEWVPTVVVDARPETIRLGNANLHGGASGPVAVEISAADGSLDSISVTEGLTLKVTESLPARTATAQVAASGDWAQSRRSGELLVRASVAGRSLVVSVPVVFDPRRR
jgi:hypothetical protein